MFADDMILPSIYNRIGMADYSANLTPKLINFAQQHEWAGRRIVDLGCGTGAVTQWLVSFGYNVTSIDYNPAMLEQLKIALEKRGHTATLLQADVRQLPPLTMIDMVIALGLFNELDNLRDLETALKQVSGALTKGRFFIFDMYTIEGLTQRGTIPFERLYDGDDLTVYIQRQYDYDRQNITLEYDVFRHKNGNVWERAKTKRILRAYPVLAIITLVKRFEFDVVGLLDTQLTPIDAANPKTSRVIFVLKKQ